MVKIIVAAAVQSDGREKYVQQIQELSPSSQTELMGVINEVEMHIVLAWLGARG